MAENARDVHGRFVKGCTGNPGGRPKGVAISVLIDSAVTQADWISIISRLVTMAKHGNLRAIEMLLDRRFGKPVQKNELTGEDGGMIPVELFNGAVKKVYGGD